MSAMIEPHRNLRPQVGDGWAPPLSSARPTTVVPSAAVVALRQRRVVQAGSLGDLAVVAGDRLVTARDAFGQAWWIPAEAVWSDADAQGSPERPRPIGLATATGRDAALLAGLSDRLGWEAVVELERGHELAAAPECARGASVLDGRLGHDVPTVVVVSPESVRWGAGATWAAAIRRACFGQGSVTSGAAATELRELEELLGRSGVTVAGVDLDTPVLRRAGIARCSVQLMVDTPRYVRGTRVH